MKLSVVLPILNEEVNIARTIQSILTNGSPLFEAIEIVAVNDGSTDHTADILSKLSGRYDNINLVTHPKNRGYGAALKTGIKHAKYDWILFMDSDLQFDIKNISDFLPYVNSSDYDFIVGYRKNRADDMRRKIVSKIYNKMVHHLFGLNVKDVDCAFKLMNKPVLKKINNLPDSFFVSAALMVKAQNQKIRIKELPVLHLPRVGGVSTVTITQISRTLKDLIRLAQELNREKKGFSLPFSLRLDKYFIYALMSVASVVLENLRYK